MTAREFDISDVLSITTGYLVSRRHMDGVYEILNFMTGDNLFTHALPRASRECEPVLLAQHPDLADIVVPELHSLEECVAWLDAVVVPVYGATRSVEPLAAGDHTVIDPLAELKMLRPDLEPVVVVLPEDGP